MLSKEKEKENFLVLLCLCVPGQRQMEARVDVLCARIGTFRTVSKILPRPPPSVDLNALPAVLLHPVFIPPPVRYPTPQNTCMKPDQCDARALT